MIKNISNLGDAALYCDFGQNINREINSYVIKYFNKIQQLKIDSINNITPSYNKLIISFDLKKIKYNDLKNLIEKIQIDKDDTLDKKILEKYFNKEYFCYMTGFIAGMPFLGDIDKKIRLERLETPRVKVPKGAVGITEQFANIYTFESPGGWNILGSTPTKIFDQANEKQPTLICPGDKVLFYEISKKEYFKINGNK